MSVRVLCIDDDPESCQLVVDMLGGHGFVVDIATNARDGYAAIVAEPPDLVLCDILMPEVSGLDLLERLSALSPERFGAIPFVFLTALADRESVLKGRRLGADDYVTKPIDFDLLVEVIRARLGPPGHLNRHPEKPLTDREVEVLTWVARGKSSAEIALLLGVGYRTVDFHMTNILRKLGVTTRVQAVLQANLLRLIRG